MDCGPCLRVPNWLCGMNKHTHAHGHKSTPCTLPLTPGEREGRGRLDHHGCCRRAVWDQGLLPHCLASASAARWGPEANHHHPHASQLGHCRPRSVRQHPSQHRHRGIGAEGEFPLFPERNVGSDPQGSGLLNRRSMSPEGPPGTSRVSEKKK